MAMKKWEVAFHSWDPYCDAIVEFEAESVTLIEPKEVTSLEGRVFVMGKGFSIDGKIFMCEEGVKFMEIENVASKEK